MGMRWIIMGIQAFNGFRIAPYFAFRIDVLEEASFNCSYADKGMG